MRLRFTLPALDDLSRVLSSVAAASPSGAKRVRWRIRKITELLKDHPFSGTPTDDPRIRRLTVTPYPYLIFYQVTGDDIIIHAVRHAARRPESMPGYRP